MDKVHKWLVWQFWVTNLGFCAESVSSFLLFFCRYFSWILSHAKKNVILSSVAQIFVNMLSVSYHNGRAYLTWLWHDLLFFAKWATWRYLLLMLSILRTHRTMTTQKVNNIYTALVFLLNHIHKIHNNDYPDFRHLINLNTFFSISNFDSSIHTFMWRYLYL